MRNKDQILLENLYSIILLEKDHRQKMVSFGLPQEVADYLHNLDDKYSIWFADKIKNMSDFQSSTNKINWINVNLLTKMQGILDWVRNVPNINLKQYNWDNAVQAQSEYHENIQVKTLEGVEQNKIIKKYNDGFYWVDLESTSDCSESSAMGHCGRTGKADTLYSLRKYSKETQEIEPFITMAISPSENTWYQCKGKRNSKPKLEYYKYIVDILITENCFKFKTEYSSTHDFTNMDFKQYVEQHSNEIPNSNDILEKILGDNITSDDFFKIYNEYEFNLYNIQLDSVDDGVYMYTNSYFDILLNYNEFSDIPNIKSAIQKNSNDYYSPRKSIEYITNMMEKFNVFLEDLSIGESDDGKSFYIKGKIEDTDNYYQLDDSGLKAFKDKCDEFYDYNNTFDGKDFKEKFKIAILKERWVENEYSKFVNEIDDNGSILRLNTNDDYDVTIDIAFFKNPLKKFENKLIRQYFTISYIPHRELSDKEKVEYPYIQYTIDFFKYFLFGYLKLPDVFSIGGDENGDGILTKMKLTYNERLKYNFSKLKSSFDLFVSKKEEMTNKFNMFCESILIPLIENSTQLTINDVYIDDDELLNMLDDSENENRYTYRDLNFYNKKNRKVIGSIFFSIDDVTDSKTDKLFDKKKIDSFISNKIEKRLSEKTIYQSYDPKHVSDFFNTNFDGQMSFKKFFKKV